MNLLFFIYLPAFFALLAAIIPGKTRVIREAIASIGAFAFLILGYQALSLPEQIIRISWFSIPPLDFSFEFRLYDFSRLLLLFLGLFTLLNVLYSIFYFRNRSVSKLYYPFVLLTLAGASVIVLADNFFVLLLGWEIVTLLLFFLVSMGEGKSAAMAAGKAFAILGFTDVAMIFSIAVLPVVYGTWNISALQIQVGDAISTVVYLLLFSAAIAKAGAIPFHSWIPDAAQKAPLPVIALLPSSLDKLLGIYLLARLTLDVFQLAPSMLTIMLILGAATLIFASLMSLIQSDLKKFLGFATISQVGFMLLGFGSGTLIGIIAALFHMINHAIYKTLLFFGAGVIEKQTGSTRFDELGGLARLMPWTFVLMTIGVMAASGVPPFNAFISKWMVYQSMLDSGQAIFLIAAMFGSAISLAAFLKMWIATFLGQRPDSLAGQLTDAPALAKFSMLVPALLCVFFGIFAQVPLNQFIGPVVGRHFSEVSGTINMGTAFYNPTLATFLLLFGLLIGVILFTVSRFSTREVDTLFIGGEKYETSTERYAADHFYETVRKLKFFGTAFREGEKGVFDIYNLSSDFGLIFVNMLKRLHDGVLSTYLAWCIIGLGVLSFILLVIP